MSLLHSNELNRFQGEGAGHRGARWAAADLDCAGTEEGRADELGTRCPLIFATPGTEPLTEGLDRCRLCAQTPSNYSTNWTSWETGSFNSGVVGVLVHVHNDARFSQSFKVKVSVLGCVWGQIRSVKLAGETAPGAWCGRKKPDQVWVNYTPSSPNKKRARILSVNWCSNQFFISESFGVTLNIAIIKSKQLWF